MAVNAPNPLVHLAHCHLLPCRLVHLVAVRCEQGWSKYNFGAKKKKKLFCFFPTYSWSKKKNDQKKKKNKVKKKKNKQSNPGCEVLRRPPDPAVRRRRVGRPIKPAEVGGLGSSTSTRA